MMNRPASLPSCCLFYFLSLSIFVSTINGMFLLKHKLAFAPQSDNQQPQDAQRNQQQQQTLSELNGTSSSSSTTPTKTAASKLPIETINIRREVEKIYEKWMLERRNQMFDKMKQGIASPSEAKAFQEILEEYFGDCICEKDSTICRIYGLTC